jgi:hypothetical protein
MEDNNNSYILSEIRKRLASNAHLSWSGRMAYLFEHSRHNKNGSVTMPKRLVERWGRQMKTDFDDLSKQEQESDYVEADMIINLIKACLIDD